MREGIDALADIHEAHSHIHKVYFGMLVKYPHDLAGVHSGTTTDSDNAIGSEGTHSLGTFLSGSQRRIGSDFEEAGVSDAKFVELVGNGLSVAILEQELVGDDEDALLAHNVAQLLESGGQAATLKVNFFRSAEPQHIFFSFCNKLGIE